MVFARDSLRVEWANEAAIHLVSGSENLIGGLENSLGGSENNLVGASLDSLFQFKSCEHLKRQFLSSSNSRDFSELHENQLVLQHNLSNCVFSYRLTLYSQGDADFVLMWITESPHSMLELSNQAQQKELIHLSRLADVGRLSAGIAHELNNPLMLIQGYTENIGFLMESDKLSTEDMTYSVRQILKSISRMSKILSGIKRFVRNDEFNMVRADLNEIIPDACQLFRSRMSSIEAELEVELDVPRIVKCDPGQIEQIIMNIMNNAFHALQEIPENRKVKISFIETNETLTLKIWNNGPEVPVEFREKIMSPFFTTKKVGEGTGLGLSVSYGIMKSHNGDLRFESSEENGTCFYLDFPKLKDDTALLADQGKVLVADSEASFTWMFSNKLRLYGFEVLIAESGAEVLNMVETNPDLLGLFIDSRLPDISGLELTKTLRKIHGSKHQIFIVSSHPMSFKEELAIKRTGIDDLLEKPIPTEKLSSISRTIIEHKGTTRSRGR